MYFAYLVSVENDKKVLHDLRLGEKYSLADPVVTMELNTVNSFTFNIYPSHCYYENIVVGGTDVIEIYNNDELMLICRILVVTEDIMGIKSVVCEGNLSYFHDVIYDTKLEFNDNVYGLFSSVISKIVLRKKATTKCPSANFFSDKCNISGTFENTYTDYPTCWQLMNDIINKFGGYLRARYVKNDNGKITTYIDYLSSFDEICNQTVEIGKNIKALSITSSGENLATYIFPTCQIKNTTADGSEEDVTIDLSTLGACSYDINAGGVIKYADVGIGDYYHTDKSKYIAFRPLENSAGCIYITYTDETATTDEELAVNAVKYLRDNNLSPVNFTVTIIDLSLHDNNIPEIEIAQNVPIYLPTKGINTTVLCTKKETHLTKPDADNISLGNSTNFITKRG